MAKKVIYPFEFEVIPINDEVLDALGFGQYEDANGVCGTRSIILHRGDVSRIHTKYPGFYQIGEHGEDKDHYGPEVDASGIREAKGYKPRRYSLGPYLQSAFFVHEIYDHIVRTGTDADVSAFKGILYKAQMLGHIDAYKKYISRL